jgi:hypothetical protein
MIFKLLNPNRIRYVISKGVPFSVLIEFFNKNQKRLIPLGMKLDSIPKDPVKALNIFIGMSDKAVSIAYEWFSKRFSNVHACTPEEAISAFLLDENDIKEIDTPEKIAEYCQFILLNLLSGDPSEKLVSFMKTPILKLNAPMTDLAKVAAEIELQEIGDIIPGAIAFSKNYNRDKLESLTDSELIALIPISDRNHLTDIKDELKIRVSSEELQKETFQEYISLIERYSPVEVKVDILIKNSITFDSDEFIPTDYQVLAVVTNVVETSRTVFVRVLGLFKNGALYKLTNEQRRSLFPENGDIIWLSRGHRKVLEKNEFGLFKIDLDEAWGGKGAKYFVKELQTQVFPVSLCEHSLRELSRVEYWLSINEFHLSSTDSYVLLSDNTLVKPNFTANSMLDFEKPMDLYRSAEIYILEGDYYSLELGASTSRVDFSSPETYFKKLIRSGLGDKLSLSREAQGILVDEFIAIKSGQNSHKIEEIITVLDELLAKQTLFSELVDELERSPKVQQAINEGIEKVVSEKTSQADALRNQIKQLEDKKVSLEKVTSREEEQIKKLRQGLSRDIKLTFEKAIQDGRKTLSEIALFQAIMYPQSSGADSSVGSNPIVLNTSSRSYSIAMAAPSKISFEDHFRPLRFRTSQVGRLFETLTDVYLLGLTPTFIGSGARIFADTFANSFAVDFIVDINIGPGAISVPELLDQKILLDRSKIYLVKNFDISPISLYGHSLVDLCYKKFLAGTPELGVNAILTFEDSGLGLSYPQSLNSSIVIIDVDTIEFMDEAIDLDGFQESIRDGGARDEPSKRALFNIIRSLKTFEGIDDAARFARLCGFLRQAYFKRFIADVD